MYIVTYSLPHFNTGHASAVGNTSTKPWSPLGFSLSPTHLSLFPQTFEWSPKSTILSPKTHIPTSTLGRGLCLESCVPTPCLLPQVHKAHSLLFPFLGEKAGSSINPASQGHPFSRLPPPRFCSFSLAAAFPGPYLFVLFSPHERKHKELTMFLYSILIPFTVKLVTKVIAVSRTGCHQLHHPTAGRAAAYPETPCLHNHTALHHWGPRWLHLGSFCGVCCSRRRPCPAHSSHFLWASPQNPHSDPPEKGYLKQSNPTLPILQDLTWPSFPIPWNCFIFLHDSFTTIKLHFLAFFVVICFFHPSACYVYTLECKSSKGRVSYSPLIPRNEKSTWEI